MTVHFRPQLVRPGDRPPPMVPAEVDLPDMPKGMLPLNVCKSEWGITATGDEFRTGIALWTASFHEKPAGSLPSDDRLLARLADFGRDVQGFMQVREKALEGWIECGDGRLYRRSVAIEALAFWIQRLVKRKAAAIGNASRWDKDQAPDVAEFDRQIFQAGDALGQLEPTHPLVQRIRAHRAKAVREQAGLAEIVDAEVDDSADASAIAIRSPKVSEAKRSQESSLAQSASATRATPCGAAADDGPGGPPWPPDEIEPFPPGAFEQFWSACPERIGYGAAKKAFEKVQKRRPVSFPTLMAAFERYKRTKPPDRAWCHPATWLNQERWKDGAGQATSGGASTPGSSPQGRVFVEFDTPAWRAWQAEARKRGIRGYPPVDGPGGKRGWHFPSEWPPRCGETDAGARAPPPSDRD